MPGRRLQTAGLRVLQPLRDSTAAPAGPRRPPPAWRLSGIRTGTPRRRTPTPRLRSPRSPPASSAGTSGARSSSGREHRREHQRVQLPPPVPVGNHAEVAEVDLDLTARGRVVDPHRHPRPRRRVTALRRREPGQRPVRNPRSLTRSSSSPTFTSVRSSSFTQGGDLVLPPGQGLPRRPVPRRGALPDRSYHHPDQVVE